MSSSTITVTRCDRCAFEAEMRQPGDDIGWGRITAARKADEDAGGRRWTIGAGAQEGQYGADLCPRCAEDLFGWWQQPTVPITPGAPAAPPPRRYLTREDKAIAIAIATGMMRQQVEQAFAAVRDQPTSLLGGQILPGGLSGIDERARALVDGIALQLHLDARDVD